MLPIRSAIGGSTIEPENSHQPFRRRGGAMAGLWDANTLQKFAAPRSKTTSTRTATSTAVTFSNRTALLLWPSGVNSPPESLDRT